MKKRQQKVRLIRAAIQLIFFIAAPSLFSTAFAGIKSIFLAIGGQQSVTWNSFLDITALLLIITILFGRHFCGYACAFGSLGDALYELTTGRLPKSTYIAGTVLLILIMVGMCTQERFFCQFLCPMGAVFAIMPILPGALFKRNRPNCAPKCTLCKKRCPAHLDIDGDTSHSGECICCHACTAVCPRKNIHSGTVIDKN